MTATIALTIITAVFFGIVWRREEAILAERRAVSARDSYIADLRELVRRQEFRARSARLGEEVERVRSVQLAGELYLAQRAIMVPLMLLVSSGVLPRDGGES